MDLSNNSSTNFRNGNENWRCIYCGVTFHSKVALKIHFSEHNEKVDFSTDKCCCSCGKYFSEFHYFENHLLQTGHMNDSTCTILPPDSIAKSTVRTPENLSPRLSPVTLQPRVLQNEMRFLEDTHDYTNNSFIKSTYDLNLTTIEGFLFIYGTVTNFSTGKLYFIIQTIYIYN